MDLEEDPGYRRVDRETVELIGVITKAELVYNEEEEVVDMCEAIRQMLLEASEKGITQGLSQGLSQGELLGSYQTAVDLGKTPEEAYKYVSARYNRTEKEVREIIEKA